MLSRLRVDSFALIDHVDIDLGPGLTVITGETGAGKSILIGALNSILGAQVSPELVRAGADRCEVEGLFEFGDADPALQRLGQAGFAVVDGQLVLRREIRPAGRSRAFIDGHLVPVRRLREVGRLLVDLHGQHEHQSLLDPDSHARFLDECGGLATEATEVSEAHSGLLVAREALIRLQGEQRQLREEEELRSYQLEEIRRLAPEPGEDERLERDVSLLANQETLARTCLELYESLYGADDSEVRRLGQARRELEQLQRFDPDLGTRVEAFSEIVLRVEDLAAGLRDYADSLEADPTRLEASRERLEELRRLSRRHGGDLESVLATAQRLEGLEDRSRSLDADLATAEATRARADGRFAGACAVLSGGRQQARDRLGSAAEEGLGELGMEAAAFRVELTPRESPDAHGAESVEFHVSANRGEPLLPLARVASGGELSRIMLALKQIIAERDPVSTLVFDEVDTGISGRVAAAVGRRLGQLSQTRQTLVITHLPQIASGADAHFSVRKSEQGDRTVTEVVALEGQDRAQEIAGLLAGEQVSDTALRHAQEMLE